MDRGEDMNDGQERKTVEKVHEVVISWLDAEGVGESELVCVTRQRMRSVGVMAYGNNQI